MKKLIALLIISLAISTIMLPVYASSNVCDIPDLELSLSIPNQYDIITPGTSLIGSKGKPIVIKRGQTV